MSTAQDDVRDRLHHFGMNPEPTTPRPTVEQVPPDIKEEKRLPFGRNPKPEYPASERAAEQALREKAAERVERYTSAHISPVPLSETYEYKEAKSALFNANDETWPAFSALLDLIKQRGL